jgi:hypothetical protein
MGIKVKYVTEGDYIYLVASTGDKIELSLNINRTFWNVNLEMIDETRSLFFEKGEYSYGTQIIHEGICWTSSCSDWYFENYRGVKQFFKSQVVKDFQSYLELLYKV